MSPERIIVDPDGDTLVILQELKTWDLEVDLKPHPEVQLLCSKKHLTLASGRASRMFKSNFRESVPNESDGLFHWVFAPVFDPTAFEIVLKVIHGKNGDVPKTVEITLLAGIAAVVDDLGCHDAVQPSADLWLAGLRPQVPSNLPCYPVGSDLPSYPIRWVLVAFVFNDDQLFERATRTAILVEDEDIATRGLPVLPIILEHIKAEREDQLQDLMASLDGLVLNLLEEDSGCNAACTKMMLGGLLHELNALKLYSPRPISPFPLLNIASVTGSLGNFKSEPFYNEAPDISPETYSRVWRMERNTTKGNPSGAKRRRVETQGRPEEGGPPVLVRHNCCLGSTLRPITKRTVDFIRGFALSNYKQSRV